MDRARTLGLVIALGCILPWVPPAWADDPLPPPPPPDMAFPTAPPPTRTTGSPTSLVPVPDVRGRGEQDALRQIAAAGLRLGGVERVSVERLAAELGRRYAPGVVVQQAPPPSSGDQPSWSPRGSEVWLRVAAARDEGTVQMTTPSVPVPTQPVQPARPIVPVPVQPVTPTYPSGTVPPRPPPPYAVDGSPLPTGPSVGVPQQVSPQPPFVTGPPVYEPAPPTYGPTPEPQASDLALLGSIQSSVSLPCERRRGRWHVRPLGGASVWLGTDRGSTSWYAGVDIGHTFSGCFGVDAYYRYAAGKFDRLVPGGLVEDSGGWHHVGLKGTYVSTFSRTSPLFGWVGLGVGYFSAQDYMTSDSGFEGYGEVGLGYMASGSVRVRLGVMFHAMDTDAVRENPVKDGQSRLLWLMAPTLGVEIDL